MITRAWARLVRLLTRPRPAPWSAEPSVLDGYTKPDQPQPRHRKRPC